MKNAASLDSVGRERESYSLPKIKTKFFALLIIYVGEVIENVRVIKKYNYIRDG